MLNWVSVWAGVILAALPTVREPFLNAQKVHVPAPDEIIHGLLSDEMPRRIAALKALGVSEALRRGPQKPGWTDMTKVSDVRLIFTNLDEDRELEALVITAQQSYASAGVFDKQQGQWFRVALLGCWCKYENDPLTRFLELAHLVDPEREDLIVRDSLGGTGVYWRDAVIYRMKGGELREVLRIREEDRNCNTWRPGETATYCEDVRSSMTFPHEDVPRHIVVVTVKGRIPIPPPIVEARPPFGNIMENPKPVGCKGYAWNEASFRFIEDRLTTSIYCPPAN